MNRKRWERVDEDLWRLKTSADACIVIHMQDGWKACIDFKAVGVFMRFEEIFDGTRLGLAAAKWKAERVWDAMKEAFGEGGE